jgi:succinate-semialdehyde dehydrogenase/glutarate-semialdehyde dehydrogenase
MKPADQRSINPSTGEVIQTIAMLTDPQLEGATATAAAHYEVWRRQSYAERAVVVRKAASILAANVDAFARLATLEMGKRISEARGEVKLSARILD